MGSVAAGAPRSGGGAPPANRAGGGPPPARAGGARLPARYRYDFAGLAGAVAFFCLSLTPSLLPRGWLFQAVAGGIVAAIGYGLGALVGWLVRRLTGWPPPAPATRGASRGLRAPA